MAKKLVDDDCSNVKLQSTERFLDVVYEPQKFLSPVKNYEKVPLASLEEAVKPIEHLIDNVQADVWIAKRNSKNPQDGLSQDESAAIYLYSMESLYCELNRALRDKNRERLVPFFPYLKLFLTALWKLPSEKCIAWRGVKADISDQFEEGETFVWWGLSSCTTTLSVLQSENFLGKKGHRTLFNVECINGKMIHNHSHFPLESEVLLLPCSYFVVVSKLDQGNNLHTVHVRQLEPPVPLIHPPFDLTVSRPTTPMTNITIADSMTLSDNSLKERTTNAIPRVYELKAPATTATPVETEKIFLCPQCNETLSNIDEAAYLQHMTSCINTADSSASVEVLSDSLSKINTGPVSVITTTETPLFSGRLREKPKLCLNINSEQDLIAANDKYLLYCASNSLCLVDEQGHEKLNIKREFGIHDICWSSYLNRFLILSWSKPKLYLLDINLSRTTTKHLVRVKEFATYMESCTCDDETLMVSSTGKGSVIEVYSMFNWNLIRIFKPPVSCKENHSVDKIRFNSDGLRIGVTIRAEQQKSNYKYWFEIRNPRNMHVLHIVDLNSKKWARLVTLPNQQFLISSARKIALVDSDGKITENTPFDTTTETLSIALMNEKYLIIHVKLEKNKRELRFFDF
ncbi:unnamed protein product [Rotaria sp. Silwood1]|nr:unnamed protein product [Rotaria sp. Silwood1]CAF3862160.1 unnamed protein product [Rotaria sp. Silwood1]CAF4894114.1 unnamed protein product [Rotaria sp. Silwood1]CAF4968409.1 unnamed protein product [Rotaria sp. Silwood1]